MMKFFIEDCWGSDGRKVLKVKSPLFNAVNDFSSYSDAFSAAAMLNMFALNTFGKDSGTMHFCNTREEFDAAEQAHTPAQA